MFQRAMSAQPDLQHTLDVFPPPMEVIKDDMYYDSPAPPEYRAFNNNHLGENFVSLRHRCILSGQVTIFAVVLES